jgi:flagellar protein FlbD
VIVLTRLNQVAVVLNSDLIETIESTPDTLICLSNGQKLLVREQPAEIVELVRKFRSSLARGPILVAAATTVPGQCPLGEI